MSDNYVKKIKLDRRKGAARRVEVEKRRRKL